MVLNHYSSLMHAKIAPSPRPSPPEGEGVKFDDKWNNPAERNNWIAVDLEPAPSGLFCLSADDFSPSPSGGEGRGEGDSLASINTRN